MVGSSRVFTVVAAALLFGVSIDAQRNDSSSENHWPVLEGTGAERRCAGRCANGVERHEERRVEGRDSRAWPLEPDRLGRPHLCDDGGSNGTDSAAAGGGAGWSLRSRWPRLSVEASGGGSGASSRAQLRGVRGRPHGWQSCCGVRSPRSPCRTRAITGPTAASRPTHRLPTAARVRVLRIARPVCLRLTASCSGRRTSA